MHESERRAAGPFASGGPRAREIGPISQATRLRAAPSPTGERAHRNLAALENTAATSRVLNLHDIEKAYGHQSDYLRRPLFRSGVLNRSLIVKHRLRADERYMLDSGGQVVTKVMIPFSRTDLSLGAQSVFIGMRGWETFIRQVSSTAKSYERDLAVMKVIDALPSLDPFILRQSLKQHEFDIAECYFALSSADIGRMFAFVSQEIASLVRIAMDTRGQQEPASAARMAEALLSAQIDDRLEPLRLTLALDGDAFRDGVFCWKGFLYYKWALDAISKDVSVVSAELDRLVAFGERDLERRRYFEAAKVRLKQSIIDQRRCVLQTLKIYDDAFAELTRHKRPTAFREFLTTAPTLFVTLGEQIGGLSHIASFWRYRFPLGTPLRAALRDAVDLMDDFADSLDRTEQI